MQNHPPASSDRRDFKQQLYRLAELDQQLNTINHQLNQAYDNEVEDHKAPLQVKKILSESFW